MSGGALLTMAGVGLLALLVAGGLLVVAARRRRPPARYASRLAATMFAAVGLILIVFASSYRLSA